MNSLYPEPLAIALNECHAMIAPPRAAGTRGGIVRAGRLSTFCWRH